MSIFLLVSVAEETGLNLTLSETPKTGFLRMRPNLWRFIVYIKGLQDRIFKERDGSVVDCLTLD